jgi:hypothetical protein
MVAPYTLILTTNESKKAWPPRKTAQNDGYIIYNRSKYKKRRIRRRRIVPTRKIRRDKKRRIRKDE